MLEKKYETDVLVIGCGVGGAVTALAAADNGCKVIMLSRKEGVEDTSTVRAQGGIIYKGKLPPEELGKDIQTAGCGRCWQKAVGLPEIWYLDIGTCKSYVKLIFVGPCRVYDGGAHS